MITAPETYRDGTQVYSSDGKVRACFEFIGEGYYGDYDETDSEDAALYRLDVQVAAEYAESVSGEETDDPKWVYPADGSICTQVQVDGLTQAHATELLTYASNIVAEAIASEDTSVKRCMDRLSYLPGKR